MMPGGGKEVREREERWGIHERTSVPSEGLTSHGGEEDADEDKECGRDLSLHLVTL